MTSIEPPEKTQPKGAQPKTAQPKTAQPKTAQPKTAQPKTAQPKKAQPKSARSSEPDEQVQEWVVEESSGSLAGATTEQGSPGGLARVARIAEVVFNLVPKTAQVVVAIAAVGGVVAGVVVTGGGDGDDRAPIPPVAFVDIDAHPVEGLDECAILENTTDEPVTMTRWVLADDDGHAYEFPEFVLGAGEQVTVWSREGVDSASDLYWGRAATVWNDKGDFAELRDNSGTPVATYEYRS